MIMELAASRNLTVKAAVFIHRNTNFTQTSPDGKTHIDFRWRLVFRTADCDVAHYLVVAKVRERLAVNKQR
jgi:hypothetical protein